MALLTGLRKAGLHVVRVRGALIVLQVARHAGGHRDVVIVVDVAVDALPRWDGVRPRQRETRARVVETCSRPGRCVVALLSGLRKSALHVIGIRRSLVILQVAGDAGRSRQIVVVVDVAIDALPRRHRVRPR